jgi:UDP-glucose 4-epimerase
MKNILITGASGHIGNLLINKLSEEKEILGINSIVATDISPLKSQPDHVQFVKLDIRDKNMAKVFKQYNIDCVVHLASIVTTPKGMSREFVYSVEVDGSKNIFKACVEAKVKRVIVSSSGAAYGYHPKNIKPLVESDQISGNYEFPYSYHKRLVEEELAMYREKHPELEQVVFRVSTVLGKGISNPIIDMFDKPVQIGIMNKDVGFNFILDTDAVECIKMAIFSDKTGIYNLAGDGYLTIQERAKLLGKWVFPFPAFLLRFILKVLKKLGLTQYGAEQTVFLEHRPLLDNQKLKSEFGFVPSKSSSEVFNYFIENR